MTSPYNDPVAAKRLAERADTVEQRIMDLLFTAPVRGDEGTWRAWRAAGEAVTGLATAARYLAAGGDDYAAPGVLTAISRALDRVEQQLPCEPGGASADIQADEGEH